ncbi:MAG: hypothetical protein QG622_3471 [Actinomycetota bacterium]|nr:hypothetical protein [Actinomycetota bacterium]
MDDPNGAKNGSNDATPDGGGPRADGEAWTVLGYLISGPALYGGLGWLLDRWLGTSPVIGVIGIIGGMLLALYLVWVRYGRIAP